MYLMKPYDDALEQILRTGVDRTNVRTGIKTKTLAGLSCRYSLNTDRFPILTRRRIWPMSAIKELLWFLSGSSNNNDLLDLGCKFWTPWVDKEFEKKNGYVSGAFGPLYGFQLRHFDGEYGSGAASSVVYDGCEDVEGTNFPIQREVQYGQGGIDQLAWVVSRIKEDPSCRRILWTLWNPKQLEMMRLAPCHMQMQFIIDDERRMTGILYQRSADWFIGVPMNIAFYSALIVMLCQQTDCVPHEFVHFTADSHIYYDQFPAVEEYLTTETIESPTLKITPAADIDSYKMENFSLENFHPGPRIDAPVAV